MEGWKSQEGGRLLAAPYSMGTVGLLGAESDSARKLQLVRSASSMGLRTVDGMPSSFDWEDGSEFALDTTTHTSQLAGVAGGSGLGWPIPSAYSMLAVPLLLQAERVETLWPVHRQNPVKMIDLVL